MTIDASSVSNTVSGLPAITGVPGVVGVPAVAFISAVAGAPAVSGIPAVAGVPAVAGALAIALILLHPYLDGIFTQCTVRIKRNFTSRLSDFYFFFYQTIGISNIGLVNSISYRIIGYRIKDSIYRTIGFRAHKKLLVASSAITCLKIVGKPHG
jgi:hypothetical protein